MTSTIFHDSRCASCSSRKPQPVSQLVSRQVWRVMQDTMIRLCWDYERETRWSAPAPTLSQNQTSKNTKATNTTILHRNNMNLFSLTLIFLAPLFAASANGTLRGGSARELGYNPHCNLQCPQNSYRKPLRQCYDNFDDCECVKGYYKEHGRCVPEPKCNFKCPGFALPKPNRECYDTIDDCFCHKGYRKTGLRCTPEQH